MTGGSACVRSTRPVQVEKAQEASHKTAGSRKGAGLFDCLNRGENAPAKGGVNFFEMRRQNGPFVHDTCGATVLLPNATTTQRDRGYVWIRQHHSMCSSASHDWARLCLRLSPVVSQCASIQHLSPMEDGAADPSGGCQHTTAAER